jgi:DNA-binding NarL/FixJ family response regulator
MYVCQPNKPKPKFDPVKSRHVVDDDEIAKLHNDGQSAREISLKLGLSDKTVEEHLKKIFDSTGDRNTLDQVAIAALYKAGFKPKPIAEKLGYNRRSIENVIWKLKKAGKL